jgi:GNAT superfamily N-acetyltransferase
MKIETSENLTDAQKEIVVRLWNAEYPVNINFAELTDFDNFLNSVTERWHYLLFDKTLKGWLMTFTRENERWFSVIIDGREQKKGYGTAILNEVKKHESEINGWAIEQNDYLKINGEKYISPIGFYEKNGFTILKDVRLEKPDYYAVKIRWKE